MAAALGALVFPPVTSLPCLQVSRETGGEGSAHQAGLHRTGIACITQLAVTVSGTMAGLSCQRWAVPLVGSGWAVGCVVQQAMALHSTEATHKLM